SRLSILKRARGLGKQASRSSHRAIGLLFFFFQAEDGIRDKLVTGVQTCALPISFASINFLAALRAWIWSGAAMVELSKNKIRYRSEERRVGKECRSRWSPYDEKEKVES